MRHVPGELADQVTLGRDRELIHQLVGHPDRRTGVLCALSQGVSAETLPWKRDTYRLQVTPPVSPLWLRLQAEVEGPLALLKVATSVNAELLGRDDLGRIRSGAVADLLVLDGDPNVPGIPRRRERVHSGQ